MRKFSPDGKYLIAFSFDQTSVEIYEYRGVTAAQSLIKSWESDIIPTYAEGAAAIRSTVFDRIFRLKHNVSIANGKQLNRECSLFTNDGRYVIVGAAGFVAEERPTFYETYQNNESITPSQRSYLEDFTLYIVDLENGCLMDQYDYKVDKIILSHNQGLYLYNSTLSVLSVQHQMIHIFSVFGGKFQLLRSIGRFCCGESQPLAEAMRNTSHADASRLPKDPPPFRDISINSLKQRLLVYLFKQAHNSGDKLRLRRFFQNFDQYRLLRIWKMQLLDDNHLLIKYASEDVVSLKQSEPGGPSSLLVIYHIWETHILAVFDNASEHLLHLFENFCDHFRNTQVYSRSLFSCSSSNNIHARLIQQRHKQMIVSAKGGGQAEATRRILSQVPINAQSFSASPYLDFSLFSYDDKLVSVMERPKSSGEYPIRFYARDSGLLKFKIYPGMQTERNLSNARQLVAFTFHPFEPFAISVQRINTDYVVNFHIRSSNS